MKNSLIVTLFCLACPAATAGGSIDYPEPNPYTNKPAGESAPDRESFILPQTTNLDCKRRQRRVVFNGSPEVIYVSENQFTEVVLDESIKAIFADKKSGMAYQFDEAFDDRIIFTLTDSAYRSLVTLRVSERRSVQIDLRARPDCADSTVFVDNESSLGHDRVKAKTIERESNRLLIEYMWLGDVPPGYDVQRVQGTYAERLVYQQGSVHFYIAEIWRGTNYTGMILEAINQGRTPFRVAVDAIDYSDRRLRDAFGQISYVTMQPSDFRLGPAPEFAADAFRPTNRGLLYLVSDNAEYRGGD